MSTTSGRRDVFDSSASSAMTSRTSTSTIRPRNRRLISINEDEDGGSGRSNPGQPSDAVDALPPSRSRDATPSPFPSRGASPIPNKYPSRGTETTGGGRYTNTNAFSGGFGFGGAQRNKPGGYASDFIESSWSSLQGLASSMLGSGSSPATPSRGPSSHTRRKPSKSNIHVGAASRPPAATWGPSGAGKTQIGAGSKEERLAMLQAKKREALLLAGDELADRKNPHKRKDSSDLNQTASTATSEVADSDAFVYVHYVQPTDSITGVTIKYGCQPAVMRKANGFWPSDSIQTRKTVLLPVEACTVKGRRIPSTDSLDLLNGDVVRKDSSEDLSGSSIAPNIEPNQPPITTYNESPAKAPPAESNKSKDTPWKHEHWVRVEGFPEPVEIGRVPRRTLGFFPRTRRKSQPFIPYTDSETGPSTTNSSQVLVNCDSSPNRPTMSSRVSASSSPSRISNRERSTSGTNPSGRHPAWKGHRQRNSLYDIAGPGGVGTLDRDVIVPGPAPDRLNTFFQPHLPNLSAPQPVPYNSRRTSFSSTSTALSTTSSTGFENFGGAIEGWMRKMGAQAKAGIAQLQQGGPGTHQGLGHDGQGFGRRGGMGDLIELDAGLEGSSPLGPSQEPPIVNLQDGVQRLTTNGGNASARLDGSASYRGSRTAAGAGMGIDRFKDD